MKVIRDGKAQTLQRRDRRAQGRGGRRRPAARSEKLGLTVQNLTPEIAESLGIDPKTKGVVVAGVEPGSAGRRRRAAARRRDPRGQPPAGREESAPTRRRCKKLEKGKSVLLLVRRGDNTHLPGAQAAQGVSRGSAATRQRGDSRARSGPPFAMLRRALLVARTARARGRRGRRRDRAPRIDAASSTPSSSRSSTAAAGTFPSRIYSDALPHLSRARPRARPGFFDRLRRLDYRETRRRARCARATSAATPSRARPLPARLRATPASSADDRLVHLELRRRRRRRACTTSHSGEELFALQLEPELISRPLRHDAGRSAARCR